MFSLQNETGTTEGSKSDRSTNDLQLKYTHQYRATSIICTATAKPILAVPCLKHKRRAPYVRLSLGTRFPNYELCSFRFDMHDLEKNFICICSQESTESILVDRQEEGARSRAAGFVCLATSQNGIHSGDVGLRSTLLNGRQCARDFLPFCFEDLRFASFFILDTSFSATTQPRQVGESQQQRGIQSSAGHW